MSLLWRDEVSLYVAPRRIALARRARGLSDRLVAATEVAVDGGSVADPGPMLRRLATLLEAPEWQGADVRLCIADHWVRYAVTPQVPVKLDAAGRLSHARFLLADTYGEELAQWDVALQDQEPGRCAVVSAVLAGLTDSLSQILGAARLRIVSMQPHLVVAYNAWRRLLPESGAWFITLREGWLAGAHLTHGAWDRVYCARLASHAIVELERLQRADRFARPAEGADPFFVEAPAWMRERLSRIATDIEWLETVESPEGPAHEIELLLRIAT